MSRKISRLSLILAAAAIATAFVIIHKAIPKPQPLKGPRIYLNDTLKNEMSEIEELAGLDKKVTSFMRQWHIKGASLSIMRNDSLLYSKGYGWADEAEEVKMEPRHILRMASVSKLITAVGIMVLQERDSLSIKDTVFGPSGILNDSLFNSVIKDRNYHKITVEHLLRHQGGFYRDPLFSSKDVMLQMRLDHPPTKEDYFTLVLGRKMKAAAGERRRYSNFGYIVLSEIIEKVSGQKYEDFINEHVMYPAGCYDTHIAGVYYKDKRKNEVRYYTHEGDGKCIPDFNNPKDTVERCYGGTNLPLLSGAGGWCCSPVELARFVASIDGNGTVPDIISEKSVRQMTEDIDGAFSLGWNDTDPKKGWNRTGSLAGTHALIHQYPDGECWIFMTNTSTYKGFRFTNNIEALVKECRRDYRSKLPSQDLFE